VTLNVAWYDEAYSIIVATITPTTTWEEYHQIIDWIVSEAKKVDHRVDIIFHDNVGMPKGNPIPHIKSGSARIISQPNIHFSIIAGTRGSTGFVRAILETLSKLFRNQPSSEARLLFLPTLDDALAHIKQDRLRVL
jgi:hypothetical protein